MNKKLSILICSIDIRTELLSKLMSVLDLQLNSDVEVLVEKDNGKISIGKKRNILLRRAKGEYISYIDDDDLVSDDYVSKILEAISHKPDCCGIEGEITTDGTNPRKFIHSIKYTDWFEKNGIYYRNPNHLNPIKKEIASQIGFPEIDHGEDKNYSANIYPLLNNEVYIDSVIYHYLYSSVNKKKKLILTNKLNSRINNRQAPISKIKKIKVIMNHNNPKLRQKNNIILRNRRPNQ